MRYVPLLAAAAIAALASFPAAAQMKPGLWEINNKMGGNPQMDAATAQMQQQMATMPPEQRKQVEAMMAQRGMSMPGAAAGGGTTMRICMTKDQVEHNDVPMREGCTMTKNSRSGNVTKVAFTCSNPPSTGEGEYTYLGPDAFGSKMKVTSQVQGRTESITMEGSGKFLGSDCGSIKPMVPPKK
jgi:hypothetical protein